MKFFEALRWPNDHMDLRYETDKYTNLPVVTRVYDTDRANDADVGFVTREFASRIKQAQDQIESNRIMMLVLYIAAVLLPALVLTVVKGTILPAGFAVVYAFIVIFVVEMFNQVTINRMLKEIDDSAGNNGRSK